MNKDSTKYYSNKQERLVAKSLGGKQVSGSGASIFSKGDVRVGNKILVECKTSMTEKTSYSIKQNILDKIEKEAKEMGKYFSMLAFNFGPNTKNYYVLNEEAIKFFVEKVVEEYE